LLRDHKHRRCWLLWSDSGCAGRDTFHRGRVSSRI
jgi:hypothetical protein